MTSKRYITYSEAGVDEKREQDALGAVLHHFKKTYTYRQGIGTTALGSGHFANVLDLGAGLGLALTTDGIGTKLLIADALQRYETIGIDCVANNVNDLLCLGAEPIALLDYIATNKIDEAVLEQIAIGLARGAELARISIPGGEIAQVREMLSPSEGVTLDLVGSAVGLVSLSPNRTDVPQVISGKNVCPGDVIIGIASSGLHSNGYSLARKVLLNQAFLKLTDVLPPLGRSLGEELLTPTAIYVELVMNLLKTGVDLHGVVHISGGGMLNLGRLPENWTYYVDAFPAPPPIFGLIQDRGQLPASQMFSTFNMGIGMAIVCAPRDADTVIRTAKSCRHVAMPIGVVTDSAGGVIELPQYRIRGQGEVFQDM